MRALKELPELESKVESGELKITQIAQVQSFLRSEKKEGKAYSLSEKKALFQETIGKSTRETERALAEKSPSFAHHEKLRPVTATETLGLHPELGAGRDGKELVHTSSPRVTVHL